MEKSRKVKHREYKNQPSVETPGLIRRLWRRVENAFFYLAFFFVILYFLLQAPPVQNRLVRMASEYLSEELHTKVSVGYVDFELFDNLQLERVYLQDLSGDTLIYVGELTAGLNTNVFSVLYNRLEFTELSLSDVYFNLKRKAGQKDDNLAFLLDYFKSPTPKKNKKKSPFPVRVQYLKMHRIAFTQMDEVKGEYRKFALRDGVIQIQKLDIPSKIAQIRSVDLNGLSIDLEEYPSRPLPVEPESDKPAPSPTGPESANPFVFSIGRLKVQSGVFALDNFYRSPAREAPEGVMDYDHLFVPEFNIEAEKISFTDDLNFAGILKHFSARESSGFALTHGEAASVLVNDTITALYGASIQTEAGALGDTIALHYNSYRNYLDFVDSVTLDLRLKSGSAVRIADISCFSKKLADNRFFKTNHDLIAELSGRVGGKIGKKLRVQELDLRLGTGTRVKGGFRSEGLSGDIDESIIEFEFELLQSDFQTIAKIIPGFSAPKYFYTLGQVAFIGDYQIFYGFDHILHGKLNTDVGNGLVDMNLNMEKGREKAEYSGRLQMSDFDLGKWTGNRNLGKASFNLNISEGSKGLTLPTMLANLSGSVDTLEFKGYTYRNIHLDGIFQEKVFEGKLKANDPNLKFTFDGSVDFRDTIPQFLFSADIEKLRLKAVDLTKEDITVSGEIPRLQLRGKNIDNLSGRAEFKELKINQNGQYRHEIAYLKFESDIYPGGNRNFTIESDVLNCTIYGRYSIARIPDNFSRLFAYYQPEFAERLGLERVDTLAVNDNYQLWLDIVDTKDLTRLLHPDFDTLKNVSLRARVDAGTASTAFNMVIPHIAFKNHAFENVTVNWFGQRDSAWYNLGIPITRLPNGRTLSSINFKGDISRNNIGFKVLAKDTSFIVENVNLTGYVSTVDSMWQVRFDASEIALFKEPWLMPEDNYVRFGRNYFETNNFQLFSIDNNRRILLDGDGTGKGLTLRTTNFDLSFLNQILKRKSLQFRGKIKDFDVEIADVFAMRNIGIYLSTDTVFLNDKPYGELDGNITATGLDDHIWWKLILSESATERPLARVAGGWTPKNREGAVIPEVDLFVPKNEFRTLVTGDRFPLRVLETFVPGISETAGQFDLAVTVGGPADKIGMDGMARIDSGEVVIDYLKSRFYIHDQEIRLTKDSIWVNRVATVWDGDGLNRGSRAFVRGGLKHKYFREWGIQCQIQSEDYKFLVLNTTKADNSLFYGQGRGKFRAQFSGDFVRTNMVIDAEAAYGTLLSIPLSNPTDAPEVDFIKFKPKLVAKEGGDKNLLAGKKTSINTESTGLDLEMNLTVMEDAKIKLIFDEEAGDIIESKGFGDLKMTINRDEEFRMYGSYNIRQGQYLFTLLNFVRKPFKVKDGGRISWYGDPYAAIISIDATYEENTSVYNLLRDELQLLGDLAPEASKSSPVVVTMHLKGDLLKPDISFDLDFPNATGQLKTLIDNKMRLLKQDQNELNRQVFGLVVVGSFLPANSNFIQSADALASGLNTLTQVLSNQLSNYLTGLASEWFGSSFSSIDFNIAYNQYQNELAVNDNGTVSSFGRELQFRLSGGFNNDRILIEVGSQFGLGGQTTNEFQQDAFLGQDVTVQIVLTEDRQWRVKIYQRLEPDFGGTRNRLRFGAGISFKKDYDSFQEMVGDVGGFFRGKKGGT